MICAARVTAQDGGLSPSAGLFGLDYQFTGSPAPTCHAAPSNAHFAPTWTQHQARASAACGQRWPAALWEFGPAVT